MKKQIYFTLCFIILIALAVPSLSSDKKLSLKSTFNLLSFEGEWTGYGEAIIPRVRIPISIEGKATFAYDSIANFLRTSIEARKFLFTYIDSGHLYHNPETDSIVWEVWDGFGEYGIYNGLVTDTLLTGTLRKDNYLFHINIDFVTADSMVFYMTAQKGFEGKEKPQATISLWRNK
ncbi:MAG: hypothetical protein KAR42_03360 [candidate division Zixibacteria bacterium]|nr:hypothetical protein [candidate division Zixibacteria bacterium]